jgi:hypothetical protein
MIASNSSPWTISRRRPSAVVLNRLPLDLDPSEIHAGKLAEHLVVVARHVDDTGAALGALHDPPDDVVMRGRPIEFFLQPPAVDDVADQIHRLAIGGVEEIYQQVRRTAACAEVDIADPDGPKPPPLSVALGLRNCRRSRRKFVDLRIEGQACDRIHCRSLSDFGASFQRV